jgi:hypothetical protein
MLDARVAELCAVLLCRAAVFRSGRPQTSCHTASASNKSQQATARSGQQQAGRVKQATGTSCCGRKSQQTKPHRSGNMKYRQSKQLQYCLLAQRRTERQPASKNSSQQQPAASKQGSCNSKPASQPATKQASKQAEKRQQQAATSSSNQRQQQQLQKQLSRGNNRCQQKL